MQVGYHHVVFTLPHELSWLALQNKRVVYDLLLQASAATLLAIAADPNIWARRSAFSACSTPGARRSYTIRMSTA